MTICARGILAQQHSHSHNLISYKGKVWGFFFFFGKKMTLLYFFSVSWGYCRVDEALAVAVISTQRNDPVVHGESLI